MCMTTQVAIFLLSLSPALAAQCPSAFEVHTNASCPKPTAYKKVIVQTSEACCAACAADKACGSWVFDNKGANLYCRLKASCTNLKPGTGKVTGISSTPVPPAPPSPPPQPQPAPRAGAPNVIVLLTDDQDVRLGSMAAMPYTVGNVIPEAVNMSNFFVNTPICCPSRTTLLSGRMNHNNKARDLASSTGGGMCMRMNTSQGPNPQYWQKSFVHRLWQEQGYTTGLFGKVLNNMKDYGCDTKSTANGIDRHFILCNPDFYGSHWVDEGAPNSPPKGTLNITGNNPNEYSTSLIGNTSLAWIKSVVESGKDHRPFFAYLGPHAPHLPSTPAQWYMDHPVGELPIPKESYYGYLGADKHAFFPSQPSISAADEKAIQIEHSNRLRSLLSVDDIIKDIREYLVSVGEWDNTVLIFTSDHGYALGQFRQDSHKTQVYDHVTRVPMLIKGPGFKKNAEVSVPASMADIAPTIMDLASGSGGPIDMDGHSFAPQLHPNLGSQGAWPRDTVLIEYQSIRTKNSLTCEDEEGDVKKECLSAYGYRASSAEFPPGTKHFHDGPLNTFSALRILGDGQDLLYSEFADVNNPDAWHFAPDTINFYELYNVSEDFYMMTNIYNKSSKELKDALHARLHKAIACKGRDDCSKSLSGGIGQAKLLFV